MGAIQNKSHQVSPWAQSQHRSDDELQSDTEARERIRIREVLCVQPQALSSDKGVCVVSEHDAAVCIQSQPPNQLLDVHTVQQQEYQY